VGDVWLRHTRGYSAALVLRMIGLLGLVLLVAAAGHALGVGFVVWAAFVPLFLWQFVPRYRISDDRLTVWWVRRRTCHLPDVTYARLYRVKDPRGRSPASLLLVLDGRIKIRLADSLWCHCNHRPADLRALAASLARSARPEVRTTASWLRWFADDPERPWPAESVLRPVRRPARPKRLQEFTENPRRPGA
jgi:hypothetical protein